jgi:hypothetical protein
MKQLLSYENSHLFGGQEHPSLEGLVTVKTAAKADSAVESESVHNGQG